MSSKSIMSRVLRIPKIIIQLRATNWNFWYVGVVLDLFDCFSVVSLLVCVCVCKL